MPRNQQPKIKKEEPNLKTLFNHMVLDLRKQLQLRNLQLYKKIQAQLILNLNQRKRLLKTRKWEMENGEVR